MSKNNGFAKRDWPEPQKDAKGYTKGEWGVTSIVPTLPDTLTVYSEGRRIALIMESNEANAHLIAAAPDCYKGLKDALREICRMCVRLNPQHEGCTSCEEMERSRLPLAKAVGGN